MFQLPSWMLPNRFNPLLARWMNDTPFSCPELRPDIRNATLWLKIGSCPVQCPMAFGQGPAALRKMLSPLETNWARFTCIQHYDGSRWALLDDAGNLNLDGHVEKKRWPDADLTQYRTEPSRQGRGGRWTKSSRRKWARSRRAQGKTK